MNEEESHHEKQSNELSEILNFNNDQGRLVKNTDSQLDVFGKWKSLKATDALLGEGNGTPLQYSCLENPWVEEPGRLQFMGLRRVRHN